MRPCRRCSFALNNNVLVCPRCGDGPNEGPSLNADPPQPPARGWVWQGTSDVADLLGLGWIPALAV